MSVRLALADDTMLGRLVAERIGADGPASLFAPEVVAAAREAVAFVLNFECFAKHVDAKDRSGRQVG